MGYSKASVVRALKSLQDVIDEPGKLKFGNGDPNSTSGFLVPTSYIFAAKNIDVDVINNAVLQMLPGDAKIYFSADSSFNDAGEANNAIPNEYLNTITVPGMPLHRMMLKV